MNLIEKFHINRVENENFISQERDLTRIKIDEKTSLLLAVDSDGGIGNKKGDPVQVPPETLGRFAVRVPLMEIIAASSQPLMIIDALTVEMEDTGKRIIAGIKDMCRKANADSLPITGSTEENVPTQETGIGIMVLGTMVREDWTIGSSRKGDLIAAAGIPKSAPEFEVRLDDEEIISFKELQFLRQQDGVRDILPVGSKGIRHEMSELAHTAGCNFNEMGTNIDLERSGGPATCVIFSAADKKVLAEVRGKINATINEIGETK